MDRTQEERLNVTVEPVEGSQVKITVTVPAAEVDKHIAAAYNAIAGKVRIPGFRKGKVPRPVIDANVGREAVLSEATEGLVNGTFPDAIEQAGIFPAEPAEIDELTEVASGADYVYTAEVRVRPELEISGVDGIVVEAEPAEAGEEEIDAQIDYLRDRFASLEPVEDRAIEPGDFAQISFVSTIGGEPYDNNEIDGLLYEIGRGQMPQEFDDALLGARVGDEVVSEFVIPETSSTPEYVGKTARFEIKISEIKAKLLPELDDEFAISVGGYESIDALRKDIRDRIDGSRAVSRKRTVETEARKALAERLVGEISDDLVDLRRQDLLRQFQDELVRRDMTLEDYMESAGLDEGQIEEDVASEARELLGQELALEALFRREGLEVGEGEVDEQIELMAENYETDPAQFRESLRRRGLLPEIRQLLMHRHATDWLVEHIEIKDVEPEPEEAEKPAKPARKSPAKTAKGKKTRAAETASDEPAAQEAAGGEAQPATEEPAAPAAEPDAPAASAE